MTEKNYEKLYEEYINKGPDGTELSGAELEALLSWRDQHPQERLAVEREIAAARRFEERVSLLEASYVNNGGDAASARAWALKRHEEEVEQAAVDADEAMRAAYWQNIRSSF